MARPESDKTIVKRRKALHQELNISKRLLEEARTKSAEDPKAFAEYLTVDIYIESMLSTDIDVRRKAAKDMLAYSLAKRNPQCPDRERERENQSLNRQSPHAKNQTHCHLKCSRKSTASNQPSPNE